MTVAATAASTAVAAPSAAAQPSVAPTSVDGPYRPDAYQAAVPVAPAGIAEQNGSDDRYGVGEADRYVGTPSATTPSMGEPGMMASDSSANRYGDIPFTAAATARSDSSSTASTSVAQSIGEEDRYGAIGATEKTTVAAAPTPQSSAAPVANDASPAASKPDATSTVQLTAPAGQYRPAGTSSYPVQPAGAIEIASRPENGLPSPAKQSSPSTDVRTY
jgi:hypothetical protein